jgi:hypothetical protein
VIPKAEKAFVSENLLASDRVLHIMTLQGEYKLAFMAWSKALFDSSSEGIEDSLIRSVTYYYIDYVRVKMSRQTGLHAQWSSIDYALPYFHSSSNSAERKRWI